MAGVDAATVKIDGFGPDRLDEADAPVTLAGMVEERERGGGLAAVLGGGGDEDLLGHTGIPLKNRSWG